LHSVVGKTSVPNLNQVCAEVEHVGWEVGLSHISPVPVFFSAKLSIEASAFDVIVTEAPCFRVMNTRNGALVNLSAYLDTMR
jgi:hypothetical protein